MSSSAHAGGGLDPSPGLAGAGTGTAVERVRQLTRQGATAPVYTRPTRLLGLRHEGVHTQMAQRVQVGPISGFPEWLPELRLAEQRLIDTIRTQYELFGFAPIETPAVERMSVLTAKGGVQRQIFTLGRPEEDTADDPEADRCPECRQLLKSADHGLHFDLTVPLARYVAQHSDKLTFPFRRYQIQKVWRGERAQRGRFREFYQCDIDVIGSGELDLIHDAEFPVVINSTFESIGLEQFTIHISNRKILSDLLASQGTNATQAQEALRVVDRLEGDHVEDLRDLLKGYPIDAGLVVSLLQSDSIDGAGEVLRRAGASEAGLNELQAVVDNALALGMPPDRLRIDFSIVRGLDYYTGTVYETFVTGQAWPSVCSGGRFDDLASYFTTRRFPGVGISIGASRLFDLMVQADLIDTAKKTPTQVLVTMQDRDRFLRSYLALGRHLRSAGLSTELYLERDELRDQIGYASSKGIPVAVIAGANELAEDLVTVRDLRHRAQETVTGDGLVSHIQRLLG